MSGSHFDQLFYSSTSPDLSTDYPVEPGTVLVRAARSSDLSNLAELLASGFHAQDGLMGWAYPLFRMGILEDLRTRFRSFSPHHVCLVTVDRISVSEDSRTQLPASTPHASTSHALVGTIEMNLRHPYFWQVMSARQLYISNLAVSKHHRRQGIAHQLLLACERVALDQGFQDLYLHVLENNVAARQLYTKLGYAVKTSEWSPTAWVLGQPQQLFLHKSLSPLATKNRP